MKKEEMKEKTIIGKSSIILFGVFLIIGIVFYVSLSMIKNGDALNGRTGDVTFSPDDGRNFNFGLDELIYSVVFAFVITGFLLWVSNIMKINAYLGVALGIVGGGIIAYGISRRYWGVYTTVFMGLSIIIGLIYLGINFWNYKELDKKNYEEFDDE